MSVSPFSARAFNLLFFTRNEEAGHYLTTYKQFEFKSPSLIKERVEKDYHSILRSSLTSISKVNKTDVETLRMNFGVSAIIAVLPILIMQQSFAKMTRATPDQLQNLPGFGQVKVKNIKNAFEKPFHNQTTSSIAVSLSQKKPSGSKTPPVPRPARPVSPEWGIEGDDVPLPVQDEVEVVDQGPLNNQLFDVDLDLT